MTIRIGIAPRTTQEIRQLAEQFLQEHRDRAQIPVQIEELVDNDLRIHVYPLPQMRFYCATDAFISSDFTRIAVEENVYYHYENRLRFSLAHEVGHLVLHREAFSGIVIEGVEQYRQFQNELDPEEHGLMEEQADLFAGLILVPPSELTPRFQSEKSLAARKGISLESCWDRAIEYVASALARDFKVSAQAMKVRLRQDQVIFQGR